MSANPVLRDLSGNGHDATCYNFAWSGVSGIGGYKWNFNNFFRNLYPHTDSTIHLDFNNVPEGNFNSSFENIINNNNGKLDNTIFEGVKIRVRGVVDSVINLYMHVNFDNNDPSYYRKQIIIKKDGEYELPDIDLSQFSNYTIVNVYYGFSFKDSLNTSDIVDIEQLPLYPNALVSDGVDDYAYVEGLPILTDYTVIAKRKWLQTEGSNNDCFAAKGNNLASFLIERYGNDGNQECYSFGQYNGVNFALQEDVIYQTKESYNGFPLKVGTAVDVDNLVILARTSAPLGCIQAALYSFILFDRTLTTEEIEWVKKNMIEGDMPSYELDPSLIDAWIFSGLRNEDAPASIVGEKGIALQCYNFAWNEEGSGFKDGALWFDGVDDFMRQWNCLVCNRNVTVIGRRKMLGVRSVAASLCIHGGDFLSVTFLDYNEDNFETEYGHPLRATIGGRGIYYDFDSKDKTFWGTKESFNGEDYTLKPDNPDDNTIYTYNMYLGQVWSGNKYPCAWYYLAVYDKVMTEQEALAEIEKLEKIWSNRLNNN